MKIITKTALLLGFITGIQAHAGVLSLESVVNGAKGEAAVRIAIREYIQAHPQVVYYFAIKNCKVCTTMEGVINQLLSEYPDITFVIVDLAKYNYLKNGSQMFFRFYKNGIFLSETKGLNKARLKALLDKYYRP